MTKNTTKKKKANFNWNYIFLGFVFLAIIYNSIVHIRHPAYRYYKSQIEILKKDLIDYRRRINIEIIGRLTQLTNIVTRSSSILPDGSDFKFAGNIPFNDNDNSTISTNYPSFSFDHFSEVSDRPYVSSGAKYYTIGDNINGYIIRSISPQFVQIGDRFFPIKDRFGHSLNKMEIKSNDN